MKVVNIDMIHDWKDIDMENDNIDVWVYTDDGYSYSLSLATPKNLQFLMEKEKMDYDGPGYPFILVNKLTPEIIEQAVKAFAEEDGGYWLKVYHFAGSIGIIDESTFDQLKAKRIERRKELDRLDNLPDITNSDELELDEFND
jgi:hypothetical protein